MTTNEIICKNIANLRRASGMSQSTLAEKLNITFQSVSKWENNLSCPDISLLPMIADVFGVSIDFLFNRKTTDNTGNIPETDCLSWPDDDNLYAVIFKGRRLLKNEEITEDLSQIEFKHDGPAHNITSHFSITIENCTEICDAKLNAGSHITCGDINIKNDGYIKADSHITCTDINTHGNIQAGSHMTCADINSHGYIRSGSNITAADITCHEIHANSNINCININSQRGVRATTIHCPNIDNPANTVPNMSNKNFNLDFIDSLNISDELSDELDSLKSEIEDLIQENEDIDDQIHDLINEIHDLIDND